MTEAIIARSVSKCGDDRSGVVARPALGGCQDETTVRLAGLDDCVGERSVVADVLRYHRPMLGSCIVEHASSALPAPGASCTETASWPRE
jgi:hypothetical protein